MRSAPIAKRERKKGRVGRRKSESSPRGLIGNPQKGKYRLNTVLDRKNDKRKRRKKKGRTLRGLILTSPKPGEVCTGQ